jgi:hypothetical protein
MKALIISYKKNWEIYFEDGKKVHFTLVRDSYNFSKIISPLVQSGFFITLVVLTEKKAKQNMPTWVNLTISMKEYKENKSKYDLY